MMSEQQALARDGRDESPRLHGSYREGHEIDARLAAAQRRYHLVSPFTAVGKMPEGCAVQFAMVRVEPADTYPTGGGKLGLSKGALDRIASAVGIDWDPVLSRRLDDGRHPHYCHYKMVGRYRAADGQWQTIQGEKEFDVRDGSPQIKGKSPRQIEEMRMHVLSHAETKARLRAIRSMGIRTGYTQDELKKPFVCARVVFTGETDDVELRRQFSLMTAASFHAGASALYGSAPSLPAETGHAPPPVGSVPADDDDFIDATGEAACSPSEPEPTRPAQSQRRDELPSGRQAEGEPVLRFGRAQGTPISEANDRDLEWYAGALRRSIEDPDKARFRSANEADLRTIEDELARRQGGGSDSFDDEWPES